MVGGGVVYVEEGGKGGEDGLWDKKVGDGERIKWGEELMGLIMG